MMTARFFRCNRCWMTNLSMLVGIVNRIQFVYNEKSAVQRTYSAETADFFHFCPHFCVLRATFLRFACQATLIAIGAPLTLQEILIDGMYRVLAWVVSVMLPPMAIFFPLFTLLEDLGYLPRVAFNLDRCFQKCRACGKQALTMCMVGFYLQKGVDK